jgi:hypothetical protein
MTYASSNAYYVNRQTARQPKKAINTYAHMHTHAH